MTTTRDARGWPSATDDDNRVGPLADLRVVDIATLFAGPSAATILADFGADVLKIEHPRQPDGARTHGKSKAGKGLWWLMLGRNKRTATLDLSTPEGREIMLALAREADVVIENFRPGTLERWGLDYETLAADNPGLVLARVTGFGQAGPMARRPAFGTLAEAMSGFAHSTGQPDGPPTLPPLALADNIAGLAAAIAILTALHARAGTGQGQAIDLAIIEPILAMLGPQLLAFDQLGHVTQRAGNRSENNAPRNTYLTKDGHWVAISSSSTSVAQRVMRLVGRPDLVEQPWFVSGVERAKHADEIDDAVARWIADRPMSDVIAAFEAAHAAIAPVYDMSQVVADEQLGAIGAIATVDDPDLGPVRMQNVLFRMSKTPGAIRHTGRAHGADTNAVLAGLGYDPDTIARLHADGIV
ncbi:CaiB/BaiF CoA transferase family protein [Micromonospora eburnea]|uniref:Crotonobetainyl-CoA:carnitine CoA-transferase CaiB n=1 Tax=Micromonospora eburnea TaxID=227316 RepID=A0A1C6U9B3_9ACTN|nr:CoA transferase [Micromonospora eburnea]SCL50548.1 Crotonobetainyl-CoA:carnitine CoA-transferase CaiB [Micromonospora eburnea]